MRRFLPPGSRHDTGRVSPGTSDHLAKPSRASVRLLRCPAEARASLVRRCRHRRQIKAMRAVTLVRSPDDRPTR